ncbi:MAG: aspartate/glutamate racemase family protein [Drouetiella hepatica Uher 2000/2452]|jgi:aspartate racemase|uniref:Aspartate/glutamate racemase family protein n=1 Tax=Drouetiella hepatica Uher 2000/2452 TaxID=904376 RepID=A0A951USE4_9CYAN|nr:aspartate/glutamate racemase family protein [Drouetiella hepatica Uher 2000/2452]
MKTIGLIGGLSWESSLEYYRILNQTVKAKLGGLHSAKVLLYSFDFAEIEALQHQGDWQQASDRMVSAAQSLERGGADLLLICSNTMHKMAEAVQESVAIPLLHIADATAEAIRARDIHTVGLLGTRFTMEQDFYKGRLDRFGLQVLIPNEMERSIVYNIIYDELCLGQVNPASRQHYRQIMQSLVARGAEGIILGCTEIMLLVQPGDSAVPLFDTTAIHAEVAVAFSIY